MSRTVIAKIEWGRVVPALEADDRLLLSAASVAKLLDTTARTLRRWRACNEFPDPDVVKENKFVRWRRETILHWIQQQSGNKLPAGGFHGIHQ